MRTRQRSKPESKLLIPFDKVITREQAYKCGEMKQLMHAHVNNNINDDSSWHSHGFRGSVGFMKFSGRQEIRAKTIERDMHTSVFKKEDLAAVNVSQIRPQFIERQKAAGAGTHSSYGTPSLPDVHNLTGPAALKAWSKSTPWAIDQYP